MTASSARSTVIDPRYTTASIDPLTLRYLAMVAQERGVATERLCHGLGFDLADLQKPEFRISYRQGSLMIRRAHKLIGEPALGLIVGARQTPVSWGLVGFGMMSCATLGEATEFGLRFQQDAGSLADITLERSRSHWAIVPSLIFFDPDIEVFLIEEMFAGMISIARHVCRADVRPTSIDVVYRRPAHAALYADLFGCPVHFSRPRNRLLLSTAWVDHRLATHDALVARNVQSLIERSLLSQRQGLDLVATIERSIRERLQNPPTLARLARSLHTSERTLRRKLGTAGYGYQALVEAVRKARALELLTHSDRTVAEVATETGFGDVRNFRKAFRRWTGVTPTEIRDSESSPTRAVDPVAAIGADG